MWKVFFLAPFFLCAAAKVDPSIEIKAAAEAFLKKHNIPGLALGIVYPEGSELKEKIVTLGNTDRISKISIKDDTAFRIGRLSETLTATLVTQLARDGKFKLDDTVESALPRGTKFLSKTQAKITVANLLHHCSALPKEITSAFNRKDATSASLMHYITHLSLTHAPGKVAAFSDSNYAMLSLVINNALKTKFHTYMAEEFLPKLGLLETKYELTFHEKQRAAIGHRGLKLESLLGDKVWSPYSAARGLYSKPIDLLKWLKMQIEEPQFKQLQESVSIEHNSGTHQHGMGWEIVPLSNQLQLKTFKISDVYLGQAIYFAFLPTTRTGIFIVSNMDESLETLGKESFALLNTRVGNL
ncbi:MAG: serine hydrolase [Simkaniaceae bacterium]|nr:serine hydrolase [Simkaniaceae bacterium]